MRDVAGFGGLVLRVVARVAVNKVSDKERFYGSRSPVGFGVFLNLHPRAMNMGSMGGIAMQQRGVTSQSY